MDQRNDQSLHIKLSIVGLIFVFILLSYWGLNRMGPTPDEPNHYRYGWNIWHLNSDRFDDSKMPVSALNVLPRVIRAQIEKTDLGKDFVFKKEMAAARSMTILFSVLVAIYVYRWASQLYGKRAGLFSLFLYIFSPNILAHSRFVTTDLYCAGMILISLYYLWLYLKEKSFKNAFISAFVLGLSQLTKFTCILLYPIFAVILAYHFFSLRKQRQEQGGKVKTFALYLGLIIFVSLFVINVGYFFNRSFTPLKNYSFVANGQDFKRIESVIPWLGEVRSPVPYPYLQGLYWVRKNEVRGYGYDPVYLLGKVKERGKGFIGYYFVAFLYKEPIAVQLFFILAVAQLLGRFGKRNFSSNESVLLIAILFFAIYFNFFFKAQMGFRHFLMVVPLIHVFCGILWKSPPKKGMLSCHIALMIYYVLSALSYAPFYLQYFNELVGDRKNAYRILGDSNISWSENGWYLEQYLHKHPEAILNPDEPVTGKVVVATNYVSLGSNDPERYRWLREHFEPVDHIAYSYLVYDIKSLDAIR